MPGGHGRISELAVDYAGVFAGLALLCASALPYCGGYSWTIMFNFNDLHGL